MTRNEISAQITDYFSGAFDIPAGDLTPEARLIEDLELDSIDAVDMAVKLQEMTGSKVELAELRTILTVGDVIALVEKRLRATEAG